VLQIKYKCPLSLLRSITSVAFQCSIADLLTLSKVIDFFAREDPPEEPKGFNNTDDGFPDLSSDDQFFDANNGCNQTEHGYSPPVAKALVTVLATADRGQIGNTRMLAFTTDWYF
jgi:hypothetical protein